MPPRLPRPKPEDLGLEARINLEWKISEIADAGFQAAVQLVADLLDEAAEQARANVAPGHGPGPHPHLTGHGFSWEDTGALADAIHPTMSATKTAGDKWVGVPEGSLVVEPIEVAGRGLVPYGAYLEFGFHPLLQTPEGPRRSTGVFRYPFLAPALYMATAGFASRAGLRLRNALIDRERSVRAKRAVYKKQPIDFETAQAIGWVTRGLIGVLPHVGQPLRNLNEEP